MSDIRYVLVGLCTMLLVCFSSNSVFADKPTISPTILKGLQAQFEKAYRRGGFAGLSVGLVVGNRLVWEWHRGSKGSKVVPNRSTLYRIGSISKVFTASLLANMIDRGEVRLSDPVSKYLPKNVTLPKDPRGAPHITLDHLTTHTSGLPGVPSNITTAPGDPYNNYSRKALYQGLPKTKLISPIGARYHYSNLAVGLLGVALSSRAKQSYATLVQKRVLEPLQMKDTTMSSVKAGSRLTTGFAKGLCRVPAKPWRMGVLDPAGGWISSLQDLAKFVSFQFRAGQANVTPISGGMLHKMHSVRRITGDVKRGQFPGGIGMGWHIFPIPRASRWMVMHNGQVNGFFSFVGFSPKEKIGLILLSNCTTSRNGLAMGLFMRLIMEHLKSNRKPLKVSPKQNAYIQKYCRLFVKQPTIPSIKTMYHPMFLSRFPVTRLQKLLSKVATKYGHCIKARLKSRPAPNQWVLSLDFQRNARISLLLQTSGDRKVILMKFLSRFKKIPPPKRQKLLPQKNLEKKAKLTSKPTSKPTQK